MIRGNLATIGREPLTGRGWASYIGWSSWGGRVTPSSSHLLIKRVNKNGISGRESCGFEDSEWG